MIAVATLTAPAPRRVAPASPGSDLAVAVGDLVVYVGRMARPRGHTFRVHAIDPQGRLYLTPLNPALSMLGQIARTAVRATEGTPS